MAAPVQTRGSVKWFDPRKGYGFIERPGAPQVFFHYSVVKDPVVDLKKGDPVEFTIEETKFGHFAHNVRRG